MTFDTSEELIHYPGRGMVPHQPSSSSTQQSNGWNPWTNPPITAPPSNMSPHYVYQPTTSQQPAAPNPWTNPPASTTSTSYSSNWSHHAVHNSSFTNSVRLYHQSAASSLWTDHNLNTCPFMRFVMSCFTSCFHGISFCQYS